jgi:hypothetical protein
MAASLIEACVGSSSAAFDAGMLTARALMISVHDA